MGESVVVSDALFLGWSFGRVFRCGAFLGRIFSVYFGFSRLTDDVLFRFLFFIVGVVFRMDFVSGVVE